MKHFRIIKENGKYYIEKRYRFLFWTHWVKLDENGDDAFPLHPESFNTLYMANVKMQKIINKIRESKKGVDVIETYDV